MQMQIANQRMQNTMQRLNDTRNYINALNNTGQTAENNTVNQNMSAMNNRTNQANDLANNERSDFAEQQDVNQASMTSKLANVKKNLGDAFAAGAYQGVQGLTSGKMMGIGSSSKNTGKGAEDKGETDSGGGGGGGGQWRKRDYEHGLPIL